MQDFDTRPNGSPIAAWVEPTCSARSNSSTRRKIPRDDRFNTKLQLILKLRRGQLITLFRHRGQLQDNEVGRDNLQLLLQHGLTGPDAHKIAPWISPGDLSDLIDEVNIVPQYWTADRFGRRVELTFKEKVKLDIRNIDCFDKPKYEVDTFYRKRRRERDAERKRQKRKANKERPKIRISARAIVINKVLSTKEWMSTDEIADRVCRVPEFANLSSAAMRQAIGRAVKELKKANLVEDKMERIYGESALGYMTRLVRKLPHK